MSLFRAFHREDEREAEPGAVTGVEVGEALELVRRQAVQACAGLLPAGLLGHATGPGVLGHGGAIGQVRVGSDQRELRLRRSGAHRSHEGFDHGFAARERPCGCRAFRHPWRMLGDVTVALRERRGVEIVDRGDGQRRGIEC